MLARSCSELAANLSVLDRPAASVARSKVAIRYAPAVAEGISPVVFDGNTNEEKLHELLGLAGEHEDLDFKRTLDLSDPHTKLDFAKDCIAMMNMYNGGYILVGVEDDGQIATTANPVDHRQFDGATLSNLVRKYVDEPVNITSKIHTVSDHPVVLICVHAPLNAPPVIVAKRGQCTDEHGDLKIVLTEGSVWVREGPKNVLASGRHWPRLLQRYRDGVVAETRAVSEALVDRLVEGLRGAEGIPLVLGSDNDLFSQAIDKKLRES